MRVIDDPPRLGRVGAIAEHHRAEAQRRYFESAVAQPPVHHRPLRSSPCRCRFDYAASKRRAQSVDVGRARYNSCTAAARLRAPIHPPPFSHARLFRGRRPAQGRDGPDRQRFVAAGRGRFRQAPQDQGRGGAAALCGAVADAARRGGAAAGARARSRISCGRSRATTNSASPISRANTTDTRPAPVEAAAVAMALAAAPMYFYKRGKGRYRKAPAAALAAALASVERKKHEAEQMAAWVRRASRGPAARRDAREAVDAALQAGQEHARMEGARRGVRSGAEESGGAARRVRRHSVDARLPLQRVSGAGLPAGQRVRARTARCRRCPSCRSPTCAHSRSTMRRRRKSTMRFRCASCRTATTRSAFTSPRPALGIPRGSPLDAIGARAAVDRLHAGPQAHDAARCASSTRSRWPRAAARRRCRCTRR